MIKYLLIITFLFLIGCTDLDSHQAEMRRFSNKTIDCKDKSEPILLSYIHRWDSFFKINCENKVYIIRCSDPKQCNGLNCIVISTIKLKK